jgi:hypothetical protein
LNALIKRWSESITVEVPGAKDKYNQCAYTTTIITGRLIQTIEETILKNGEKVTANAKLYSVTELDLDTKVGSYKIIKKKECKNKNNTLQFYKYHLK